MLAMTIRSSPLVFGIRTLDRLNTPPGVPCRLWSLAICFLGAGGRPGMDPAESDSTAGSMKRRGDACPANSSARDQAVRFSEPHTTISTLDQGANTRWPRFCISIPWLHDVAGFCKLKPPRWTPDAGRWTPDAAGSNLDIATAHQGREANISTASSDVGVAATF